MRNQIIVPCKALECCNAVASKRYFNTMRVGMYLNWKRSRHNTASTAHTHTRMPIHCLSVSVLAAQDKGTHVNVQLVCTRLYPANYSDHGKHEQIIIKMIFLQIILLCACECVCVHVFVYVCV